jgi:hypothetical protein
MVRVTGTEEIKQCPCGVDTDQAMVWTFDKFEHTQPLCRACQKELGLEEN